MWPTARQLCGTKVSLIPLSHQHATGLKAAASAEVHVPQNCRVPAPETISDEISYLLEGQADGRSRHYAVIDQSGLTLGMTGFSSIDRANKRLEIGGTWLCTIPSKTFDELMVMLLSYAFEFAGAMTVQMRAPAQHTAHREMLLSVGAEFDGILRGEKVSPKGQPVDVAVYSILEKEWPQKRNKLLSALA